MHVRRSPIRFLQGGKLGVVTVVLGLVAAVGGVFGPIGETGAKAGPDETRRAVASPLDEGGAFLPTEVADSFRVQLYATTDQGAAESFRAQVRQWWSRVEEEAPDDVFGADPPITVERAEPYYRVRIGGFASRDQALRARSFLRRRYDEAFIVEAPPPAEAARTSSGEEVSEDEGRLGGSFRVQLYATTDQEAAQSLRAKVRRWWGQARENAPDDVFGSDPPVTVEYDGTYYQVQTGAFSTREEARRAQRFLSRTYPEAFIAQARSGQRARAARTTEQESEPAADTTRAVPSPRARREPERQMSAERQMKAERRVPSSELTLAPREIWGQIRKTVRLVEGLNRDSVYTRADVAQLFEVGCDAILPGEARANALAVESSHLNRDIGLEFEARYGQRTPTVGPQGQGGLSGTYVGLDWSLLSQGLLGNRTRSDLLETRSRAEQLTAELARIQQTETCRARRIQERLRGMVPELLEAKIQLGRYRQRLLRQAYLEGEALLDAYLEVKGNVREAERRLMILRDSVHDENEPPALEAYPPLVDLNFEALTRANVGDSLRRRLGNVERRAIDLEDDAAFDTRLSVFGRYSTTRTFQNRDLEFGLRFSQPLFGALFGNDERAEEERTELRRREEQLALSEQRENLRTVHRRFEEDQSVAIRAHYRVSSRREQVRRRLGARAVRASDQLNAALQDAENLLQATIEKALAYGEVYEEVARAFNAAREPFNPRYLGIHPVSNYERRGRAGQRALYVWSEAFRERSNAFLVELAQARKIGRLIVSAGQNTPMRKVRALQARARKNNIATELLLASNHWVQPGGAERARTRIRNLDLQGSALHLDVEPHMFEDFDQREDEYLRRYLEVLRVARRVIGDENELVVSVPLFWPGRVYREIAKIVDRVHLMAYGEMETRERASRALEVARRFAPEQRVIALRPEDFANPWTLDQAISTLQKVVQADRFALHDLQSFLQFIRDEP